MPPTDTTDTSATGAPITPGPRREFDTGEIERFMQMVRDTVLYQVEWKDLLSAAPQAVAKMGACFVAVTPSIRALSLVDSPVSTSGLR